MKTNRDFTFLQFYRSHLVAATGQDVDPIQVENHVRFAMDEEDQKEQAAIAAVDPNSNFTHRGRPRSLRHGVVYVRRGSSPFSVVRRGSSFSDEGTFSYLPQLPARGQINEGMVIE